MFVLVSFLLLLLAPLALRRDVERPSDAVRQLVILTPHNEQIRSEFGGAFETWHAARYGERIRVVWLIPGGTSDIRRMLQAQYTRALRDGSTVGGAADLVFGGGQYEHDELKRGVSEGDRRAAISQPVRFTPEELRDVLEVDSVEAAYGATHLAGSPLFDADGHWFGAALSGFGLVFNRELLAELGVTEPARWRDLCHPALIGWVALANPGQSGSIQKSFDTVLQTNGWVDGWRILRRAAANARSFAAHSSRVPVDVSQGDAAAGVCIDFYGRYQAQAVIDAGGEDRLGFVDPPGEGAIDADPVSMLTGAPNPDLARRFILFCLTDEAQSLWQFSRRGSTGDTLGPVRYELRRLPIVRSFYERHIDRFVDRVNPFENARQIERPNPDYWSFVAPVFSAMAIDNHSALREAWLAITSHPGWPIGSQGLIEASDVVDPDLRYMLDLFDEMPSVPGPGGSRFPLDNDDAIAMVRRGWLGREWAHAGLWRAGGSAEDALRTRLAAFFRERYQVVVGIGEGRATRPDRAGDTP